MKYTCVQRNERLIQMLFLQDIICHICTDFEALFSA